MDLVTRMKGPCRFLIAPAGERPTKMSEVICPLEGELTDCDAVPPWCDLGGCRDGYVSEGSTDGLHAVLTTYLAFLQEKHLSGEFAELIKEIHSLAIFIGMRKGFAIDTAKITFVRWAKIETDGTKVVWDLEGYEYRLEPDLERSLSG